MANTQSIATSFKTELLNGIHAFGTTVVRAGTTKDTFYAALYLASASLGASTTAYSGTGEVSGTNYTAGGIAVTNANAPASSGTTAYWTPSSALVWSSVTLATAFDAVLIYNSTQSNKAVGVYTFGSQTITAGNLSLNMPTNDASTGLLRVS
jgi:hypothetical protein